MQLTAPDRRAAGRLRVQVDCDQHVRPGGALIESGGRSVAGGERAGEQRRHRRARWHRVPECVGAGEVGDGRAAAGSLGLAQRDGALRAPGGLHGERGGGVSRRCVGQQVAEPLVVQLDARDRHVPVGGGRGVDPVPNQLERPGNHPGRPRLADHRVGFAGARLAVCENARIAARERREDQGPGLVKDCRLRLARTSDRVVRELTGWCGPRLVAVAPSGGRAGAAWDAVRVKAVGRSSAGTPRGTARPRAAGGGGTRGSAWLQIHHALRVLTQRRSDGERICAHLDDARHSSIRVECWRLDAQQHADMLAGRWSMLRLFCSRTRARRRHRRHKRRRREQSTTGGLHSPVV
eukprot:scaffold4685_cov92-Isochrysis_galbana.AAC.3